MYPSSLFGCATGNLCIDLQPQLKVLQHLRANLAAVVAHLDNWNARLHCKSTVNLKCMDFIFVRALAGHKAGYCFCYATSNTDGVIEQSCSWGAG